MQVIHVCEKDAALSASVVDVASRIEGASTVELAELDVSIGRMVSGGSDVLFIGPSVSSDRALDAAREIRSSGSAGVVVLMSHSVGRVLLRDAMRAGIVDVLDSTAPSDEIEISLRNAGELSARQSGVPTASAARTADVITVFSTKGGVGKTVISTNIAVALAQQGRRVALIDLDLQFGDVGIMLGLEPTRTIMGAIQSGERLDSSLLEGFMVEHSSGLRVLLAPTQPEDAEMVTASRIDRILRLLASEYEFVVIDTPPMLDEAVLTAIDRSTRVIAITMMDIASIKNSRISLQKLKQLGYNGSLVEVLLNRADSKVYLRPESVEEAIGAPIKYRLPSDAQVPRAVNKGLPVVIESPRSQPARVLTATAKAIIAEREEAGGHVA